MRIKVFDKTEYELSKELWLECFPEDDRAFVDYYYANRSKPEYVLGAFIGDDPKPKAMMHLIPMKMPFGEELKDICFIAGVCTKPGSRRKGICAKLFNSAFPLIKERGFDAAVLQPFDVGFYRRFGFETFIRRDEYRVSAERLNKLGRAYDKPFAPNAEHLSELYSRFMAPFSGYSLRGKGDFERFIKEYTLNGAVLNVTENGCCAGYSDGAALFVDELFYLDGTDPVSLLPPGFSEYSFPLPAGDPHSKLLPHEEKAFSMIKTMSDDFDPFGSQNYGFDKY